MQSKKKDSIRTRERFSHGQHLLESNQCARNYSDLWFEILITTRSQFYLSLLEVIYISRKKPDLCGQKQFVITLQLFRYDQSLLSLDGLRFPYYCTISLHRIWPLQDPAHHIPNQTEIATKEFCPKSLLRKQNEIDFIESHIQILHHLKIVHLFVFYKCISQKNNNKTIHRLRQNCFELLALSTNSIVQLCA